MHSSPRLGCIRLGYVAPELGDWVTQEPCGGQHKLKAATAHFGNLFMSRAVDICNGVANSTTFILFQSGRFASQCLPVSVLPFALSGDSACLRPPASYGGPADRRTGGQGGRNGKKGGWIDDRL